jgi:hypothetical protein
MMYSATGRYTVEDMGTTLRFEMRCRKNWLEIGVIGIEIMVLIGVLYLSWITSRGDLANYVLSSTYTIISIAFDLIAFVYVLSDGLWQIVGKEVAEVDNDYFTIRHLIFGRGVSMKLEAQKVNNASVTFQEKNWKNSVLSRKLSGFLSFKSGNITLSYGKSRLSMLKNARFGAILEEAEARQVVGMIVGRFPQYQYQATADFQGKSLGG